MVCHSLTLAYAKRFKCMDAVCAQFQDKVAYMNPTHLLSDFFVFVVWACDNILFISCGDCTQKWRRKLKILMAKLMKLK